MHIISYVCITNLMKLYPSCHVNILLNVSYTSWSEKYSSQVFVKIVFKCQGFLTGHYLNKFERKYHKDIK